MGTWAMEILRTLFWSIAKAAFMFMDMLYALIIEIGSLNFFENESVWEWWSALIIFITFIITVRLFVLGIGTMFDEQKLNDHTMIKSLVKIGAIVLVIGLSPIFLKGIGETAAELVTNTAKIVGVTKENSEPSTILINSAANVGKENEIFVDGEWQQLPTVTYRLEDVEINADKEGTDEYKFFNDFSSLIVVLVVGVAACFMIVLIALQIGQRLFEAVLLLLVSPLPIASIIDPNDDSFSVWVKMIIAIYLNNFFQVLMLLIVMVLTSSKAVVSLGFLGQIIMLISGFLFLLKGVPQISRLIGGDTSSGGTLQQLASLRMAGSGVGKSVGGLIGTGIAATGKTLGAAKTGGIYGIGRMLGGVSGKDMNNKQYDSGMSSIGGHTGFTSGGFESSAGQPQNTGHQDNTANSQSQTINKGQAYRGTFAARMADKAYATKGIKGKVATAAVNTAAHSYSNARNRIVNNRLSQSLNKAISKPTDPIDRMSRRDYGKTKI